MIVTELPKCGPVREITLKDLKGQSAATVEFNNRVCKNFTLVLLTLLRMMSLLLLLRTRSGSRMLKSMLLWDGQQRFMSQTSLKELKTRS